MILEALNQYYERLESDPNVDIAPFGYSRQKISFGVVLNDDGTLHEIIEETDGNAEKPRAKSLIVLGGAKPSGAGINPCFLWDNTGYLLGFKPDDDKPERTLEAFEAFRTKHLELQSTIDDPEFAAVCTFLESWKPENAADHETLAATSSGFGVFRIRGQTHYVHQRPAVKDWWNRQLMDADADATTEGQCLLTGQQAGLARLHEPKIKGVNGAQSAGASLVSFNDKAYESFGREQGYNAPVSEAAAFQYCTALNHLLRQGGGRIQIGDATTVYWTESQSPMEEFFSFVADPAKVPAEDDAQKQKVQATLQRIVQGESVEDLELGDGDNPFYVLGLSPNAARLSIRFWYVSTLAEMVAALRQHFNDLAIVRSFDRDPEFPAMWQLLRETVRDSKDIPPLLSGAVMRAILTGSPYPQMLFTAVLRRIRADRIVNSVRAGMLKACIIRSKRGSDDVVPVVHLDKHCRNPAYVCGRLFAQLESCQIRSRGDSPSKYDNTIRDRYFVSAMATPRDVFVPLLKLAIAHISKCAKGQKNSKKTLAEIRSDVEQRFVVQILEMIDEVPGFQSIEHQALFVIGYYHQSSANRPQLQESVDTQITPLEGEAVVIARRGANELHPSPAYHAGRLLAVCQQIQDLAAPNVGTTYVDSYFSAASTNPAILCRVWNVARHRLKQIGHWGTRKELEDLATRIVVQFGDAWPSEHTLHDQSLFQLGYFQQRAAIPHNSGNRRYLTNDGQSVKSYGEKFIADTLFSLGIGYRYEESILAPDEREASGQRAMSPDFAVLSVDGERTLYIEYCGLRGDTTYDKHWSMKARNYRAMGARTITDISADGARGELALLELVPEDVRDGHAVRCQIIEAIELALGDAEPHAAAEPTPF